MQEPERRALVGYADGREIVAAEARSLEIEARMEPRPEERQAQREREAYLAQLERAGFAPYLVGGERLHFTYDNRRGGLPGPIPRGLSFSPRHPSRRSRGEHASAFARAMRRESPRRVSW